MRQTVTEVEKTLEGVDLERKVRSSYMDTLGMLPVTHPSGNTE